MTKEEMLSAIYDEMSDKTLSEWCKYITNKYNELDTFARCDSIVEWAIVQYHVPSESYSVVQNYTIIWHPVLIGDVIEYVRLKNIWNINPIADEWDYPRLPIDEQLDECIDYVYSLISK